MENVYRHLLGDNLGSLKGELGKTNTLGNNLFVSFYSSLCQATHVLQQMNRNG